MRSDLAQRQTAAVRERDHATLELREGAKPARNAVPARIAARRDGARIGRGDPAVPELRKAIKRDLDVRRREILRDALRFAVRPAGGACERVALPERVEHLAAHAAGGVGAERRAEVAAVALRGLDKTNDAPCDEVLAVGSPTPWIE